jgi:histidine ammonia-lyase
MGMTSARHLRECVANAEVVVAIELLAATQALDLRAPLSPGRGSMRARNVVRESVSFLESDRELAPDIAAAAELIRGDVLTAAVEDAVGSLA